MNSGSSLTDNKHKCSLCNYAIRYRCLLEPHMLTHGITACDVTIHNTIKKFACDQCDYKAHRKGLLRLHLSTHRSAYYEKNLNVRIKPPQEKLKLPYVDSRYTKDCKETKMSTLCISNLPKTKFEEGFILVHKQKTENRHSYKREHCDHKTYSKKLLEHYMAVHSSTKLEMIHKCHYCDYGRFRKDQCNYSTYRKDYLHSHMLVHNITEFKCEYCNFKTKHKGNLRGHILIRSTTKDLIHLQNHSDKIHICEQCDYKTHRKCYLNDHMLLHELNKFECALCAYKAYHKRVLQKLIKKKHD
nr:unnamed protein product [Callosobruchus analis]